MRLFKLHKNDNSSHKPSQENDHGSGNSQQGLQKGSESSDYFERILAGEVVDIS